MMLQTWSRSITPTTKIAEVPIGIRGEFLIQILALIFTMASKQVSSEDLAILAIEVNEEISMRHKDLTLAEVELAFKNGVNGHYGEYFSISTKTMISWLKEFRKRKVLQEQRKADGLPTNERAKIILSGLSSYRKQQKNTLNIKI